MGRFAGRAVSAVPGKGAGATFALLGAVGAVGAAALTVDADVGGAATADAAAGVPSGVDTAPAATGTNPQVGAALAQRLEAANRETSRSAQRPAMVAAQRADKTSALPAARQSMTRGVTETVQPSDPRDIARSMLPRYGWSADQFGCLDELYMHESGWNPSASNPSSGAYGIPQSLPADKMAAYGADWQTDPATQLKWGLAYIQHSYGSPCGAWGFWQANSWY